MAAGARVRVLNYDVHCWARKQFEYLDCVCVLFLSTGNSKQDEQGGGGYMADDSVNVYFSTRAFCPP